MHPGISVTTKRTHVSSGTKGKSAERSVEYLRQLSFGYRDGCWRSRRRSAKYPSKERIGWHDRETSSPFVIAFRFTLPKRKSLIVVGPGKWRLEILKQRQTVENRDSTCLGISSPNWRETAPGALEITVSTVLRSSMGSKWALRIAFPHSAGRNWDFGTERKPGRVWRETVAK